MRFFNNITEEILTIEEYFELYDKRRRDGVGEGCEETDDINDVPYIGRLIMRAHSDDDFALYYDDGDECLTIVADIDGPWCISFSALYMP